MNSLEFWKALVFFGIWFTNINKPLFFDFYFWNSNKTWVFLKFSTQIQKNEFFKILKKPWVFQNSKCIWWDWIFWNFGKLFLIFWRISKNPRLFWNLIQKLQKPLVFLWIYFQILKKNRRFLKVSTQIQKNYVFWIFENSKKTSGFPQFQKYLGRLMNFFEVWKINVIFLNFEAFQKKTVIQKP